MKPHVTAAHQYFPYYKIDPENSDICLREYDLAAKALEADHRSLTAAAGIALALSGAVITLLGSGSGLASFRKISEGLGTSFELAFAILIACIAALSIHYFSRLQRSATHAARKIVVLRRMLGMDYGSVESVLPADQLDGANEPFAIRMFPGWLSLQAIPVIAVTLLAAYAQAAMFVISEFIAPEKTLWLLGAQVLASPGEIGFLLAVVTVLALLGLYRISLFENFETARLYGSQKTATLIRIPLKERIGFVLYHLRLSIHEANRLGINLSSMHSILVHIEDKRFYIHNGNSFRSIIAAAVRWFRYNTISGGSTIYQQLARSNFLSTLRGGIRRKIVEWMLAPWLNGQFGKSEGLNAYLCSVRFAKGVLGLPAAIHHFFPDQEFGTPLAPWQKFLLIERLSNVTGTYPASRIGRLFSDAVLAGYLANADALDLDAAYLRLSREGKIALKGQIPAILAK
jgi:penicillin-binding protein 1A